MQTIYITNDTWRAQAAESAGVDRIMVDLESIGKRKRQPHGNTVISGHSISDVERVRAVLNKALLIARVNPWHENSVDEINACIAAGADILMLPMFGSPVEVRAFVDAVRGRARICLLFETGAALARIHSILSVEGADEAHIGLNDLHLSLGLDFMFEVISGGLADYMVPIIREKGIEVGIGGVARFGGGLLSPELVLSEHVRLGSTRVILSRDYGRIFEEYPREAAAEVFRREVARLQDYVQKLGNAHQAELLANSRKFEQATATIAAQLRAARAGLPARRPTDAECLPV